MNKKTWIIIGGIAAGLFLCVCVAVAGFIGYQTITKNSSSEPTPLAIEEIPPLDPTQEPEFLEVFPTDEPVLEEPTPEPQVEIDPADMSVDEARFVAGNFVLALSNEDYETALSYSVNAMRDNSASTGQLQELVEGKGLKPLIWEWLKDDPQDGFVEFTGVINFADARRGKVIVQTSWEEDEWRVNYIDLSTEGDPVDPGPLSGWSEQRSLEEVTFAKATADYFIMNWIDQDWETTYLLAAQPMKDQVGSADKIEEILVGMGVTPDTWTWDSQNFIEPEGQTRPVIEVVGTINYVEGQSGPITVQLMWEDGFWSVLYFDVKAK